MSKETNNKSLANAIEEMKRHDESLDYGLMREIVNNFECPPECDGFCCRYPEKIIEKDELTRLRKISYVKARNIKHIIADKYGLPQVCPFQMDDNRCEIHDSQPVVCELYPFRLHECNTDFYAIDPCPLGLKIVNELESCINVCLKSISHDTSKTTDSNRVMADIHKLTEGMREKPVDGSGRMSNIGLIPINILYSFAFYLRVNKNRNAVNKV